SEQPRAPFLRRRTSDMRDPFEPIPAFGAEHLNAEARACGGDGAEIARHAVLHAKQHGAGVIGLASEHAPETLTIDMVEFAAKIDHGIDRMHAERRKATDRRLVFHRAPR